MKYFVEVKQLENGELYIDLPDETLNNLEWREGDTLIWSFDEDDGLMLRKKEKR